MPYLKNLLSQLIDPMELWTLEFTMSYLRGKVTKALMPVPAAAYHIDEYTDWIGKTIAAHDSRYYVTYDFKKETKTMSLTNINVLEISIYKRWLNFEDDNVITGEKRWENDSERVPPQSGGRELPLPPRREKRAGLSALY